MTTVLRLKAGGTLGPRDFYIERPADTELPDRLGRGEYCYVLAPRQIGKSSLRVRAEGRLLEAGVHVAVVDLTQIGSQVTGVPDAEVAALHKTCAPYLATPPTPGRRLTHRPRNRPSPSPPPTPPWASRATSSLGSG